MIEGIFAVLYVSHMGLTQCYKTVVFFYINMKNYILVMSTAVKKWMLSNWMLALVLSVLMMYLKLLTV